MDVMEGPLVGEHVVVVVELLLGEPVVPFRRAVACLLHPPPGGSGQRPDLRPTAEVQQAIAHGELGADKE
jgi:hypothetical protein